MHIKNYNLWHKLKEWLNAEKPRVFFHEREVWWCSLGVNIGFEMDGKGKDFVRPVIILKRFNKEVFLCIPLTTKEKKGIYYFPVDMNDGIKRMAILSQIRLVDSKRLQEKMGVITEKDFLEIKKTIIKIIE